MTEEVVFLIFMMVISLCVGVSIGIKIDRCGNKYNPVYGVGVYKEPVRTETRNGWTYHYDEDGSPVGMVKEHFDVDEPLQEEFKESVVLLSK